MDIDGLLDRIDGHPMAKAVKDFLWACDDTAGDSLFRVSEEEAARRVAELERAYRALDDELSVEWERASVFRAWCLTEVNPDVGGAFLEAQRAHEASFARLVRDHEAEVARLTRLLRELLPVAQYVSRGRGFVDVEPYPDAAARRALGAADDADLTLSEADRVQR